MVIIILILLIILIVFWLIGLQRSLVVLDENVNNSLSQISVQLTSRFDALTSLLDLVKGYNEHEYKTLSDVIKMRSDIPANANASDIENAENLITKVTGGIKAVAEAYPDLKSNSNYQTLMNSLNDYENKVRQSRLVYNDTVTKLNRTIRMFPVSMFAPMFGISQREYLKVEESKTAMPSMK